MFYIKKKYKKKRRKKNIAKNVALFKLLYTKEEKARRQLRRLMMSG